ncbi:MAG TPA: hypothetical protein H9903_09320 [Candidatus Aquabacterium excrementipullorum]|nr:hypothetical protein [Candidatus Aquabacterium excrementipullorum]
MDTSLHDTVFERTDQGRVTALRQDNGLNREAQRLLLMMTGYTPLADLLALLDEGVSMDAAHEVVDELLHRQLIRPVDALPYGSRVKWFGPPGAAAGPAA